ncbi:PREDICTED: dnaJ homolog subfamily C member 30-like [Polistes canadensis]|uniref:dnaJ homolog subfamily C member 30-like n=1 Tax=Polistes canadensis TaxID=91411 RepID=UPI000718B83B|nr:PREDICTED: dnaJ homolog subfamily C member 30-like [Polistes canadensis]
MTITMRIGVNNHWIEKILPYNSIINLLVFRSVQFKSCAYSNTKTHYDTLEISPDATKIQIKSAYYKLSMQYHPDKNDSELAKRKFQNISEAYEVLYNYQTRKRYDRSILVKQNIQKNIPKTNYTYASTYNSKINPMGNRYFNFDEWTRQHYGETFSKRKKTENIIKTNIKISEEKENFQDRFIIFSAVFIVIIYLIIQLNTHANYDEPKKKN